jgi:hypothetical protein
MIAQLDCFAAARNDKPISARLYITLTQMPFPSS